MSQAQAQTQPAAAQIPQTGEGSLIGQVMDPATGLYLRDALIEVATARGDVRTVNAGQGGTFSIQNLPAGPARPPCPTKTT